MCGLLGAQDTEGYMYAFLHCMVAGYEVLNDTCTQRETEPSSRYKKNGGEERDRPTQQAVIKLRRCIKLVRLRFLYFYARALVLSLVHTFLVVV